MKKVLRGIVKSDKMDKTRIVIFERLKKHKRLEKYIKKTTKCFAHDEENRSKSGDKVEIVESKPLSKNKKWVITKVIS